MSKSAVINIRVEPEIKRLAEELYKSFGISLTDAINMFLNKSITIGGLPFELKQPRYNEVTEMAMREADEIIDGRRDVKKYASFDEFKAEMDAEMLAGE